MTSKRMLALLLAICLMLSTALPVSAVHSGSNAVTAGEKKQTPEEPEKSMVISGEDAQGAHTLRDTLDGIVPDGETVSAGEKVETWIAEEAERPEAITTHQMPACVAELRALSQTYGTRERVSAFVVLDEPALVINYNSINSVPADEEKRMEMWQDEMIRTIENKVLNGGELDVITRFSYLTNAIVVETEFENLEAIACLDGVRTVFINPVFYPCVISDADKMTVSSGQMSDVDDVWDLNGSGYTGEGMLIAVLDTGLDLDHPSFSAAPEGTAWSLEDVEAMLEKLDLNAEQLYAMSVGKELTASSLYYNGKVPFAFNYSMGTTNVSHADGIGDHGTHVAGITAANPVEGVGVVGMAPGAQIVAMKVFNSTTGGANMYDILNALEDCMKLKVDVANLSLGSPAGFTHSGAEIVDEIFASISTTDLIVDVAAGNEGTSSYGSLWGTYMQTTENIDNATISSPSTYANSLSIASVANKYVAADYFSLADGTRVFYQPSVEYLYEYTTIGLVETLADQEVEYVIVPNLGSTEDFLDAEGNSIVSGKVAVVKRGELRFDEKIANAEAAGAIAVLIWNNVTEDIASFGMSTEDDEGNYPNIPAALITLEDGQVMADAEVKTMVVSSKSDFRIDVNGGQMSDFSSWGVSPDLRLLPDLSGVGGNVYSCYDGGYYGLMSGTSMATPQVAGVTALVLQYLEEKYPDLSDDEKRQIVDGLMMSTAVPVIDSDTGLEASPRQQGAGLVNALNSVTAESYLSVSGSDRPKAELFDSENGSYSFTFTVHNFGDHAKTYTLSSSLLCEDYIAVDYLPGVYFMAEEEHALDNSAVSFSKNTVTVAAGGTATVTVSINLTQADKTWIDTYFPSGNYVEGYIYLTAEGEVTLSLPFLGFYGSWYDAPVFDTGFWYDEGFWATMYENVVQTEMEANQYYHIPWTSLGSSETDWVLGMNPYSGVQIAEDGSIVYNESNNVLSPNGDGVLDMISEYYLSTMRNARWIILTYTDAEGNVLDQEYLDNISKTMFISGYGATVPFVYSWYYDSLYDFKDASGEYLADGTELTLTVSGVPDYGEEDVVTDSFQIPITIDTSAPVLNTRRIVQSSEETGNYITLTFTDAHPAYVVLMNKTGTQLYQTYSDLDFESRGNGAYTVKVEVTGLGDSFTLGLMDYGCNEAYYDLTYTLTDNVPEMDTTKLYAYQVYNEYIYYYYGWDYIFGWSTIDKETAAVEMISSDAYEYYALTAAEYAGGYIFAVDAGKNLIYMTPGLWNRHLICNLGLSVVDMAFDEITGTMYLAVKDSDTSTYGLYTVDLLTGELTQLKQYDSYFYMPWAMTFVDGELYACSYYYNGFFQVDIAGGTYALNQVTLSDGSSFYPLNSAGERVSPDYAQSMTYSEKDGVIYWAYYNGDACELITIDPATWTNTAAPMEWDSEYVGLLMLEDDGYKFPESPEVTKLVIAEDVSIIAVGETLALTATQLPWNAPASQITWSSSNPAVATVDETGTVTGLTEGTVTITAVCGSISAECTVTVLNVAGTIYYYDYYTGDDVWGAWQSLDMETMEITDVVDSPVDFIAADYNGHDGMIYGFSEYGQGYKFDPQTGEAWKLGENTGLLVSDMAYDYSTGTMYATVYDMNAWTSTIYAMSMGSGKLVKMGTVRDVLITLACSTDGQLYGITYDGILYEIKLPRRASGNATLTEILQTPLTTVYYGQSMCYDHVNDVIIWNSPEHGTIYWVAVHEETPYVVDLGDPTGTGVIEIMGMFSIPEEISELPYVAATAVEADDMLVLTGAAGTPVVTASPVNATNQENVTLVSADESIAVIRDGQVVGVSEGVTTVTASVDDNGTVLECTFTVTVKPNTDNIYAYMISDIASSAGFFTMELSDEDPTNYIPQEYVYFNGVYMCVYSMEYVAEDDCVYAYGYDPNDWNANFYFLKVNPKTWAVASAVNMGDGFPFVYDMAFDYTTGAMYAVAGTQSSTDLYVVDLDNGTLIEVMLTEPMFMNLAVSADGTIYAMAASSAEYDWDSYTYTYTNSMLYTLDPAAGTYELFMDTGVTNNMLSTMAYDFDTGNIYWAALNAEYENGFYLVDLEEKAAYKLGSIGAAGAQVTGMMIFADAYPQVPETVQTLSLRNQLVELEVDASAALEALYQPARVDAKLNWSSADESIATVDNKGVVTAVASGITTVTVSIDNGEEVLSDSCTVIVYGDEDYFVTYNRTDKGFASVSRSDSTEVTNLTEEETEADVAAMEWVEGTIYAYDVNGDLFTTGADGYTRTYIGNANVAVPEDAQKSSGNTTYLYEHYFSVRDMAWDEANDRMLVAGCTSALVTYHYQSSTYEQVEQYTAELSGGCKLYEVDLETGALKELCVIGGDSALSAVYMLTVTDDGQVYGFSCYMDYVFKLDPATGAVTYTTTMQNQGVYGSTDEHPMAMAYDANTNRIYILFTEDGVSYDLYMYNVGTTAITAMGLVGDEFDVFAGLAIAGHVHTYEDGFCTGCGAEGYTLGDVNGDGKINILDANLAASYYNEVIDLTDIQLLAADVNRDGVVNILDANLIASYYNEVIDSF